MKTEDKAKKLYDTFSDILPDAVENDHETIKQCALICVDEILEAKKELTFHPVTGAPRYNTDSFYKSVKQEILNL